jgi:hypothetical protein
MLPSGYPGVIRDGIAALNWGGAVLGRALERFPEWAAIQAVENKRLLAEAKERAKRERIPLTVVAVNDAAAWNRIFTEQRAEVTELANRLERRSRPEWVSGDAAQYFSGVELRILEDWAFGGNQTLIAWLGETPKEVQQRKMEFAALGQWLRVYLDQNG